MMENNDEDAILDINGVNIYLKKIIDGWDEAMMVDLENRFKSYENGRVNKKEMLDILKSYKIILSDEDSKPLFAKIDIKKKGLITFSDFNIYLVYELRTIRIEHKKCMEKKGHRLLIKEAIKYDKKFPNKIVGIELISFSKKQLQKKAPKPFYVLANENGGMQFYTSGMNWLQTHQINETASGCEVNSVAVLPDYEVICVLSTEQLRFYSTDPDHFQLRMTVGGAMFAKCLAYAYNESAELGQSRLAVGTFTGNVLVLELQPGARNANPFYRNVRVPNQRPPEYDVEDMCDGDRATVRGGPDGRPPFRAVWYTDLHPDTVLAVAFCDGAGRWFASVSESRDRSVAYCRVDRSRHRRTVRYGAAAPKGARCVCATGAGRAATGDRYGRVTLWALNETGARAVAELNGHRAAVCRVFYDPKTGRLISASSDLTVIVWDAVKMVRLDTLDVLADRPVPQCLAMHLDRTALALAVAAGDALHVYSCVERIGDSKPEPAASVHGAPVVKTMYNALFHVLVSVSAADSMISVWNPSTGRSIVQRPMAHQCKLVNKTVPVEITAAAFDPSQVLLVTGAADGTVQVWNPSDLKSLHKLRIPSRGRISDIIWLPNKLLVTGRDRRVTEIPETFWVHDVNTWYTEHDEDVLSMCVNPRSMMLVTTTRAGVMGFWNLASRSQYNRQTLRTDSGGDVGAVTSHFMHSRPEAVGVGKLLVATCDGAVQLWCTYPVSVYVARFVAAHAHDDHVTCMSSDARDRFLFTGLNSGYVKTWHVAAFGYPDPTDTVDGQTLRLRFPYLQHSLSDGRAGRAAAKNVAGPQLVNSYRAHMQSVTHVEYMDRLELLVTSSADHSIRLWTLAGHFVGVLGTPWSALQKTGPVHLTQYAVPLDVVREASYTTLKILEGTVDSTTKS